LKNLVVVVVVVVVVSVLTLYHQILIFKKEIIHKNKTFDFLKLRTIGSHFGSHLGFWAPY